MNYAAFADRRSVLLPPAGKTSARATAQIATFDLVSNGVECVTSEIAGRGSTWQQLQY
jgi:hypothetical protein